VKALKLTAEKGLLIGVESFLRLRSVENLLGVGIEYYLLLENKNVFKAADFAIVRENENTNEERVLLSPPPLRKRSGIIILNGPDSLFLQARLFTINFIISRLQIDPLRYERAF
jgi:hypothetical protein